MHLDFLTLLRNGVRLIDSLCNPSGGHFPWAQTGLPTHPLLQKPTHERTPPQGSTHAPAYPKSTQTGEKKNCRAKLKEPGWVPTAPTHQPPLQNPSSPPGGGITQVLGESMVNGGPRAGEAMPGSRRSPAMNCRRSSSLSSTQCAPDCRYSNTDPPAPP